MIIAEGALSETFIDDDSRGIFHNAHEFDTLYADEVPCPRALLRAASDEGYEVEAVRQRLAQRAGLLALSRRAAAWRAARLYRPRPREQHRRLGAKHRRPRSAGLSRHFRRRQAHRPGAGERLSRRPESARASAAAVTASCSRRRLASTLPPTRSKCAAHSTMRLSTLGQLRAGPMSRCIGARQWLSRNPSP